MENSVPPQSSPQINPQSESSVTSSKVLKFIGVVIIIFLILVGIFITRNDSTSTRTPLTKSKEDIARQNNNDTKQQAYNWEFNGNTWAFSGTPPACPDPIIFNSPVDLKRVIAVLYPGQTRGGNYKPHGGFRLNGDNTAEVKAPLDAKLVAGSRYIEQGETQYLLFFIHPCGIAYRFDHLLKLSPTMQLIADTLPPPQVDDSRTTKFSTPIRVKKGDIIATAVGFEKTLNVSVDFGLYDLRAINNAAKDSSFAQKHASEKEQAYYGICWLQNLYFEDATVIKIFPGGDAAAGKTSDYCK